MATGEQQQPGDEDSFDAGFDEQLEKRGLTLDPAVLEEEGDEDAGEGGANAGEEKGGSKAEAQPPAVSPEDPWKDAPPKLRQMYSDLQAQAAAHEHSARSQAGRVSALQRKVDDLQQSTRSSKPGVDDPAAGGEDDDELKSLEQDFPSVVKLVRKTVKQEVDPVRENVRERDEREAADREQSRIAAAFSQVAKVHPDFDQIRRSPDYAKWLGGQAPGVQQLAHSEDPRDAISLFSMFKQQGVAPKPDGGTRTRLVDAAVETPSKGAPRRVGIDPDDFDGAFELNADRISKRNGHQR